MIKKNFVLVVLFGISTLSVVVFLFFKNNKNIDIKLDTPEKRGSYSLGYRLVRDQIAQGVQVDMNALNKGMQDAANGKAVYSNAELEKFEMILREISSTSLNDIIAKNKKIADEFMSQNKSREGVQSTPSGLQYRVLDAGEDTQSVKKKTVVTVAYEIKFLSGEVFESSKKHGEWVEVSIENFFPAMQEALQLMKSGSHWIVYAPPDLAYGSVARPGIPPNSVLIIDVRIK